MATSRDLLMPKSKTLAEEVKMVRQVVFLGKVVRFELAPATPFTKYIYIYALK